jgi:hypothetical protein
MLKSLLSEIDASEKNVKQFAYLFALIGLVIVPGIIFYKHGELGNAAFISLAIGSVFLILGLLKNSLLRPLYKAWMLLALVMGFIMTKVIITIVFYLVMTPIGLLKRSTLRKTLKLNYKEDEASYWIKKVQNDDPKRLERLF